MVAIAKAGGAVVSALPAFLCCFVFVAMGYWFLGKMGASSSAVVSCVWSVRTEFVVCCGVAGRAGVAWSVVGRALGMVPTRWALWT